MSAIPLAAPATAQTAKPQRYGLSPAHACADNHLSDNAHRVLTALGVKAAGGKEAWATIEEIGEAAGGKSPATVRRALRELESRGYITRDVIARNFTFNFTLKGRATPAVLSMPTRPMPAPPTPDPTPVPPPPVPEFVQPDLPGIEGESPLKSDSPPLPNLTAPPLSNLTGAPAGALKEHA